MGFLWPWRGYSAPLKRYANAFFASGNLKYLVHAKSRLSYTRTRECRLPNRGSLYSVCRTYQILRQKRCLAKPYGGCPNSTFWEHVSTPPVRGSRIPGFCQFSVDLLNWKGRLPRAWGLASWVWFIARKSRVRRRALSLIARGSSMILPWKQKPFKLL